MRKLLVSVLLVAALALVGNSIADAASLCPAGGMATKIAPAGFDDPHIHHP